MALPSGRPVDVSVRQFVADSGSVTRGLRQGRTHTWTQHVEATFSPFPYDHHAARFYGQICAADFKGSEGFVEVVGIRAR